jgi:hypothetical protein
MKKFKLFLWGAALTAVWLLSSSDIAPNRYNYWSPFFMKRAELEKSVHIAPAREMVDPGKIWIAGDAIYVVERYKGVHKIDNSNPSSPKAVSFLVAPGCMDIAVKDNMIYLDNAVDLVAWDMNAARVTERLKNYFPEPVSPTGSVYLNHRDEGLILVGWSNDYEEGRL